MKSGGGVIGKQGVYAACDYQSPHLKRVITPSAAAGTTGDPGD